MTQTTTKKEKAEQFTLPEGRLINQSLFERDVYKDEKGIEGKPLYKAEVGFTPADVTGEGTIEDKLIAAVEKAFGGEAADDYIAYLEGKPTKLATWSGPFLNGDDLAAARAAKGKEGDAYKGTLVIRTNTAYNKDGAEGPGGIHVYDQDVAPIQMLDKGKVFNGCYGHVCVTIGTSEIQQRTATAGKIRYVKFYLSAFQVTRNEESDRLQAASDKSSAFKPYARPANANTSSTGRRSRAG